MGSVTPDLHMLFFPLMTPGHMIPTADMAKLFVARGAKATIVTTPDNASLVQATIDRADESVRRRVALALLQLPSTPSGPTRHSSLDLVASLGSLLALREPFRQVLMEQRPDCVVADMFFPWCLSLAQEIDVPCMVFHGFSFFALCHHYAVHYNNPYEVLPSGWESFSVPGLPHRVELKRSQVPNFSANLPLMAELFKNLDEAEKSSFGVIVNSFYELEPDYAEHYKNAFGRTIWHVGPVSLCNTGVADLATRGNTAAVDCTAFLTWLDRQCPDSVVYLCFGSMVEFAPRQIEELAAGLMALDCPFIWVVKQRDVEWLPEGFEDKVVGGGKGLVVRGWAPQMLILNHPAVGGFVTHCGWNSCLEAISAGAPMVTWPFLADQFFNERMVVDVLRIGVEIGAKEYMTKMEDLKLFDGDHIARTIGRLMNGDEGGKEMRKRAREIAAMARRAVEGGGSSHADIGKLIDELNIEKAKRRQNTAST